MMTEEEARKKWCPFVHSTHTDLRKGFHHEYPGEPAPNAPCIASECMAWRWIADFVPQPEEGFDNRMVRVRGYCGLAGKP